MKPIETLAFTKNGNEITGAIIKNPTNPTAIYCTYQEFAAMVAKDQVQHLVMADNTIKMAYNDEEIDAYVKNKRCNRKKAASFLGQKSSLTDYVNMSPVFKQKHINIAIAPGYERCLAASLYTIRSLRNGDYMVTVQVFGNQYTIQTLARKIGSYLSNSVYDNLGCYAGMILPYYDKNDPNSAKSKFSKADFTLTGLTELANFMINTNQYKNHLKKFEDEKQDAKLNRGLGGLFINSTEPSEDEINRVVNKLDKYTADLVGRIEKGAAQAF